jgi:thiamine biosynthesis lipoprotein
MRARRLTALLLSTWLLAAGCERPGLFRAKNSREVMATLAELTATAPDQATAQRAVEAGYARLADVNRLMSDYVSDSEIGRLNSLEAGQGMVVSPETFFCLEQAARVSELSGGAFDATCRPLVWLWKQAGKENKLPDEESLRQTLTRVGWQKLKLDSTTRRVTPMVSGMQIDLGGVAKGYALDLAAQAMRDAGAVGVLVDVGGDVLAVGTQPNGEPWRIGVRDPFQPGLFCTLALADRAVATSGVQQRFTEIEGKRYSHIVDPRTGRPAEQAPSVTVIGPDGITADAWATAFSVLSVEEGLALLDREQLPGIEVMWICRDSGGPVVRQTPGFERYVVK